MRSADIQAHAKHLSWGSSALLGSLVSGLVALGPADEARSAGQASASYQIVADVFAPAGGGGGAGSAKYQAGLSVSQNSAAGPSLQSVSVNMEIGFQAASEGWDTDGDGIPDSQDDDADGDGQPNASDPRVYDTDDDGDNNLQEQDDDNDGLDDDEERVFGSSLVLADTDDDGSGDYQEWVAGTDPRDPFNRFAVVSLSPGGSARIELAWEGVAGREYEVVATNSLLPPEGPWLSLGTTSVWVNTFIRFVDTNAVPQQRFYRLYVRRL